jgi:hypothetical protein
VEEDKEEPKPDALLSGYNAVNHHWAHAEQERWAILYNFLMANTILFLAWVAVYASDKNCKSTVLILLSSSGVTISFLWLTISCRVNKFIKEYGILGETVEKKLKLNKYGPFHIGERIRIEEQRSSSKSTKPKAVDRFSSLIPSRYFVMIVPSVFAVVYAIMFILSFPCFLE